MRQPRISTVTTSLLRTVAACGLAASALAAPQADLTPSLNTLRAFEASANRFGPADGTALYLRAGVVQTDVSPNRLSQLAMLQPEGDGAVSAPRMVIQLDGPMTADRRDRLEAAGVVVGEYLPVNSYIVTVNPRANAAAMDNLEFVRFASDFQASWKVDPDIGQIPLQRLDRIAMRNEGKEMVTVYLFEGEEAAPAIDALRALGAQQIEPLGALGVNETITVVVPREAVNQIADLNSVQFIEAVGETVYRNATGRAIVQSGTTTQTPLWDNGLLGTGQIVGHMDSAIQRLHCSFADASVNNVPGPNHRKLLAYNQGFGGASHGSHTAGTIAGDGLNTGDTRGVAYLAKIVHHGIPNDSSTGTIFKSRLDLHHSQGARVHTNSWGQDFTTAYTGWTRAVDLFSREQEESMVAFAITNASSAFYTPENAKNGLAVSGHSDNSGINSWCTGGRGPTADGRFKPDILAPGCGIQSANTTTGCTTNSSTGTSMACPHATGTAALIRQYFTDGYYPTGVSGANSSIIPSGALLRAMITNSGQDMTNVSEQMALGAGGFNAYPNNREGWGRLLADNSLYFPGDSRRLVARDVRNASVDSLTTGQMWELEFDVNSSSEQLRVTMAFTDLAASIGSSFAPINNIDLEVVSPSGTIYKGNNFSGGQVAAGGNADAINSIEQVHRNNPEVGTWTVRVKGTAVNQQTQGFAIVITGDVDDETMLPCPGDFDGDGDVDFGDLNSLLNNYNQSGAGLAGDMDGDGDVQFDDLNAFLTVYNVPCPTALRADRVTHVNGLARLGGN